MVLYRRARFLLPAVRVVVHDLERVDHPSGARNLAAQAYYPEHLSGIADDSLQPYDAVLGRDGYVIGEDPRVIRQGLLYLPGDLLIGGLLLRLDDYFQETRIHLFFRRLRRASPGGSEHGYEEKCEIRPGTADSIAVD